MLKMLTPFFVRAHSLGDESKSQIFVSFITEHLPRWIIDMLPRIPVGRYKYIKQTRDLLGTVAAEVTAEKRAVVKEGPEDSKDLMSLLLRANAKEDENGRMSDEEVEAEIM
jgi:cytochrome P450